jgi:hypothetical protein
MSASWIPSHSSLQFSIFLDFATSRINFSSFSKSYFNLSSCSDKNWELFWQFEMLCLPVFTFLFLFFCDTAFTHLPWTHVQIISISSLVSSNSPLTCFLALNFVSLLDYPWALKAIFLKEQSKHVSSLFGIFFNCFLSCTMFFSLGYFWDRGL